MKFKKLTPQDYKKLKPFFENQRYELCEYSLPTQIAWSIESFRAQWLIKEETLVIGTEYTKYKNYRHLILPVSPTSSHTPSELYELAKSLGYDKYWFVPESYIKKYGKREIHRFFSISEQKGFKDYIYRSEDLAYLEGNKYSKKRNLIKQFQRNYFEKRNVEIQEINNNNSGDCIDFLEEWCKVRRCDDIDEEELACEKLASINTLINIEKFDSQGILLRIDGKVSAFGVVAHLTSDMAILQHEKAFENVKGLYQYFDNECIKRLCGGYTYVNKESDMNVPGLKKSKRSYHPERYVNSFELKVKIK